MTYKVTIYNRDVFNEPFIITVNENIRDVLVKNICNQLPTTLEIVNSLGNLTLYLSTEVLLRSVVSIEKYEKGIKE